MATEITVLNSKFETSGSLKTEVDLSPEVIHVPVVHQVVKALLADRREGNASTKTRAYVRGGGKKPFKQKGTGNARQGTSRSPLMPGGAVVFGPQPRDFSEKINKKVMLKAIQSVLADKYQSGKLTILDKIESDGKTSNIYKTLNGKGLLPALVIVEDKNSLALRALRNIARVKGAAADGFSVYEAVRFENLVIEKKALEGLLNRLV
ncbi:MAG: 50S ribosomal protein L4 [Pseudomonadota bacterium]